jgi:hypothetical protein
MARGSSLTELPLRSRQFRLGLAVQSPTLIIGDSITKPLLIDGRAVQYGPGHPQYNPLIQKRQKLIEKRIRLPKETMRFP